MYLCTFNCLNFYRMKRALKQAFKPKDHVHCEFHVTYKNNHLHMKLFQILFYLLLLSSCNFEPDGLNFVEVEKPTSTSTIELTLSLNEDSIYLYGDTKISFNLSTFGKKFNVAQIQYYDYKISTDQPSDTFTIYPKATSDWTDLTIDFYVSTGSGSIADKLKVENYVMSKTWKIKYIDLKTEGLNSGYHIHPDGYLELYMVLPKQKNGKCNLSRYGNDIPASRTSGDTVFFADKSYCSDNYTYYLGFTYDSYTYYNRQVTVNLPKPELKVEAIGLDSCKVSWTKSPLKLYYTINDTEYKGFENEFKTSINVWERKYFSLGVFPPDYQNQRFSTYKISKYFIPGTFATYFMCYASEKDKFFISKDMNLLYLDSPALPLPATDPDNYYNISKVNIICSPNGKYIAGYQYSLLYVYNENLTFSRKITVDNIQNYRMYFSITNDGAFTYQNCSTIVMKNLSGSDWNSFSFPTDLDPNPNVVYFSVVANSIDGKYVCVRGMNGFKIYDVSDHISAKIVFDHPVKDIGAVIAHPTDPGLIYVKQNGIMQLRTCPGFELIKTIDIPVSDYYFHSIDPYTGIMLLMTSSYYYFVDPVTSKELLKLKSGSLWNYDVKLVHNQFKMSQNVLDLTDYLKR